ncbi:branched-chain amino acid ABC transporter permease [Metarhizobium album]|uniref:Branched-chain amino acid ABC transporter permease n=1 Tax=Metarhizobium album TaxID=2182425 RepID=A0A2U2DJ86_9HYPH|nr:branched-chain amino acid ABC transporter permease [Rhizobium album]PWE53363.1 branched-chain amino acid ABC transporter permease [Rhizobium album]
MFTLQLVIAGVAVGSVYALIALGIVLIYKCSGVVNFAQGGYAMLGAFFTYALAQAGLHPALGLLIAVVLMGAVGALTQILILRPMLKAPVVAVMMVTLGILITFRAVCLFIWGPDQLAFPQLFPAGVIELGGIFMTYNYIAAVLLSSVLCAAFLAFYRYTPLGLMQRCTADNTRAALAIGIDVSRQVTIAWVASAMLAGLGGALLASLNGLSVNLSNIGLVAFPVIVLGGMTSLVGAVVGGVVLGVLQALTDGMLTPAIERVLREYTEIYSVGALQQVIPYALLVLVLLVRPQGIFGTRESERV